MLHLCNVVTYRFPLVGRNELDGKEAPTGNLKMYNGCEDMW